MDWVRPTPPAAGLRWDVLTGVLLAAGTITSLGLSRSTGLDFGSARPGTPEEIAWACAVALPLCLRRRFPLGVLIVVGAAFIGLQARFVGEGTMVSICLFVALYTAGAWGKDRRVTDAVRIVVVVAMFCWLAYSLSATAYADFGRDDDANGPLPPATAQAIYATLVNVLYFGGAYVFGNQSWTRARQQAELTERTAELQRERDEKARQAVVAERVRIARELHDVVAHHVSVMGVQAGAARRLIDTDPQTAREALVTIETGGRRAIEEMHRLLNVLRDDPEKEPENSPAPDVQDLPELVRQLETSGLRTGFTVVGTEYPVPRSVSVSTYRIAQEALTNTVRHAGASRVDVRLRYLPDGIELEVVDDGRGRTWTTSGSGLGHVGMRERVGVHDGELDLGPRPGGGYRVRARLPFAERDS